MAGRVLSRRNANAIRGILDRWLPPVIREAPPFAWMAKRWLGARALPDFKYRAFQMSDEEFSAAYAELAGPYTGRASDTTPAQAEWILSNTAGQGFDVLEIGPGNGSMTQKLRAAGHRVRVLDIHAPHGQDAHYVQGTVENIPLADKSTDIIVLAHVLEHARSLTKAVLELERVSRNRVLIVTPKQRFYRWTFDYHLHFFYSADHLASHIHKGRARGGEIDGDLCLRWDIDD